MTHNERRTSWWKEGLIAHGSGVFFGATSVAVGHPFDTVKTKMQAQIGFEKGTMLKSFAKTLRTQGLRGFYRGSLPAFGGSIIYRSTQFSTFEATYTYLQSNPLGRYELPGTGGLQVRVLIGGLVSATSRAVMETPIEYTKIRRQTQQKWQLRQIYSGFGVTWFRCSGLMTTFFVVTDSGRRHYPELFKAPVLGPFLTGGVAATFAWWVVWPLEHMKSKVQGGYGDRNLSVFQRMKLVIKGESGFFGLYRGILPGSIRSFIANGCSFLVMTLIQRKATEWGIRN